MNPDKVVHNASDRTLTEDEKQALALGLNFTVTPKNMPTRDIIAATESTARRLDSQAVEKLCELCANVSRILQTSSPLKYNLPGSLRKALKNLRMDDTIVTLPADKGNATVVMNRKDYVKKIDTMLADGRLAKDPTARIKRKIDTMLKQVEKRGEMPKEVVSDAALLHTTPVIQTAKGPQSRHPSETYCLSNRLTNVQASKEITIPLTPSWLHFFLCKGLGRVCQTHAGNDVR